MNIDAWLQAATADARRRGLMDLASGLESLARATRALRAADFNDDASDRDSQVRHEPGSGKSREAL